VDVVSTDPNTGFFSSTVTMPQPPFPAPSVPNSVATHKFRVEVAAETSTVIARHQSPPPGLLLGRFEAYAGESNPLEVTATSPTQTRTINYTFENYASKYFMVTRTLRFARMFADNHRGDSDPIGQASVQLVQNASGGTFYFPLDKTIRWQEDVWFSDWNLVHEYAHFLQHEIGTFLPAAATHNGCTAFQGPSLVNSAEYAWMEGFASWLPIAVNIEFPAALSNPNAIPLSSLGTAPPPALTVPGIPTMETFAAGNCGGLVGQQSTSGIVQRTWIEDVVTATLTDLSDLWSVNEGFEQFDNESDQIFKIFDKELDLPNGYPTLLGFVNQWFQKGKDHGRTERILLDKGIPWTDFSSLVVRSMREASEPVTANWHTGGLTVLHRGTDFGIYASHQTVSGGAFSGWTNVEGSPWASPVTTFVPASGGFPASVVVVGRVETALDSHRLSFTRIPQSQVADPLSLLAPVSFPLDNMAGTPLVLTRSDGRLEVFSRQMDGSIHRLHQTLPNGPFQGWQNLTGVTFADLAGGVSSNGRIELYHLGTNGKIYQCVNPNGACNWNEVGTSTFNSMPTVVARGGGSDLMVVCARGTDSRPKCNRQTGVTSFAGWTDLTASASLSPSTPMVATRSGAGSNVSLFYVGEWSPVTGGGNMLRWELNAGTGVWTLFNMGGAMTSPPAAVRDSLGWRSVFARNAANALLHSEETAAGFGPWNSLGGVIMGFSGGTSGIGSGTEAPIEGSDLQ
jgi:hypothetical protein